MSPKKSIFYACPYKTPLYIDFNSTIAASITIQFLGIRVILRAPLVPQKYNKYIKYIYIILLKGLKGTDPIQRLSKVPDLFYDILLIIHGPLVTNTC